MHQLRLDERVQLTSRLHDLKRRSEEHAIAAIRRALEAEGLHPTNWSFPDREKHRGRAPDAAFLLRSEPIALEVVSFRVSQEKSDSAAASRKLVGLLNAALKPDEEDPVGTVLPIVFYDPEKLLATSRAKAMQDVEGIAAKMRDALRDASDPWARHTVYPRPAWTVSVSVVRIPSEQSSTHSYFDTLGHNIQRVFEAWVDWVIKKKGDQHPGYGRAILAIQRRWMEEPATLEKAFGARDDGEIPWWRIYLVQPNGDVGLVWSADTISR